MELSDLKYAVTATQLAEACVLARGVDLLDHEEGLVPLEGVVHSGPGHVVRMGRYWGSPFRCTCGHACDGGSGLAEFCVHAAAVMVRWLANREPDPEAAISRVHDDAAPFAALVRARDALAARALERDPGEGASLDAYVDDGLGLIGLTPKAYDLHDWLLRNATPTQVKGYLVERVASLLGEDGEGDLHPNSTHSVVQVADLLQGAMQRDSRASFEAALLALVRIRSGMDQWSRNDATFGFAIPLAGKNLPGSARPSRSERERFIRTVIGLEEKHASAQIPLLPLVAECWDDDLCRSAAREVERRIITLLDLLDADLGAELGSGEGPGRTRTDTTEDLLLDIDPIGEYCFMDHRFPDVGRAPAELVHERLGRLQRLAADLAFRLRDLGALDTALRRWSGATFAEFFHRAHRWSPQAQLAVVQTAAARGAVAWDGDSQALRAPEREDPYPYSSSEFVNDVVEIHERAANPARLRTLGVEEVAAALAECGLRAEAQQFLIDLLRRDPDPRHVPAFVHCWEEAGLPTDPVDVARRILRGEYADPPG